VDLKGKRVLLTGGSSGIGFATAEKLGKRGARIVLTGRNQEKVASSVFLLRTSGIEAHGIAADVGSEAGRAGSLEHALTMLGGLDVLINNAGCVRAGRLEETRVDEIRTMIEVDLVAPIMLTRDALPHLRQQSDGMVVNVSSAIALVSMPFYATYAAVKAGLAGFGDAMRRELNGEGVHVLTVYPSGTDTPMMASNQAGPDLGFSLEPAEAVAEAIVAGMESNALTVVRGGAQRQAMIDLNRQDPSAIDARFLTMKPAFEQAVSAHSAL